MNDKFNLHLLNEKSLLIYDRGYKLYEKKASEIHSSKDEIEATKHNNDEYDIMFSSYTLGSGDNVYDQTITLEFNNNKLIEINSNCDCSYFLGNGICKHIVSSVLTFTNNFSIEKILEQNNIKVAFDYIGEDNVFTLLNTLDFAYDIVGQEDLEYELVPYFKVKNTLVYMSLKIKVDNDKEYIVKDVFTLLNNFKNKEVAIYGKNLEIEHNENKFSNKKNLEYILKIIENRYEVLEEIALQNTKQVPFNKKELKLEENEFTYFLEALEEEITFKFERDIKYKVIEFPYKLKFRVEENEQKIKISCNDHKVIKNKQNLYLFDDNNKTINKVNCKTKEKANILYQMIKVDTVLNKINIYNFKYSILNRIGDLIQLSEPIQESSREVLKITTTFKLEEEVLRVSHIIEENSQKDYPLEKISKLEILSSRYSSSYNEETEEYEIISIPSIITYMHYALPQIIKYSDEIIENEEFSNFQIDDDFNIDMNLLSEGNSLLLNFSTSKFNENELLEVLKALKTNQKYYQLKNKTYIDLTDDQMIKIKKVAEELNVDLASLLESSFKVNSYNTLYLDVLLDDFNLKYYKDQKIAHMIEQLKDFKNQKLKVSKNINVKLRDYQQEGINWLNTLKTYNLNGILADDMGLGKTLQVISLLSSIELKDTVLIIAPASLIYNWESEILKFNPSLSYKLVVGTPEQREKLIQDEKQNIIITSYDLIRRDIDLYKECEYEYIILDEGQNIKNKTSQVSKAIKVLKSKHNLVLTGTPIENKLSELWSIFDFLMPGYLGTHADFKKKYENPIMKFKDKEVLQSLQRRVKPFILRRLKSDVLKELPKKQEKVVYMEMLPKQRKVYDAQVLEAKKILEQTSETEFNKKKIEILAMITKMRQIVCNPFLVYENFDGEVIKEDILIENLLDLKATGHKTLIFSQFVSNFKYLEEQFKKNNISYYKIEGSTPKSIRHSLVDRFNEDQTDAFLISLKAGGTGLNIIGADTVIHYDPWWNTAVESQATDRAYRMGQKNNVLVYKYICRNTIEEKILKIQEEKKDLANNILDGEGIGISNMTREDFIDLFND